MSPAAKPKILTTAEFHAAVHALAPEVAVFDCDGTLWSGDAGVGFMRWTIDNGLLSRDTIGWLDDRYRAYLRGEVSELAICGEMVQIYQGLRESEMRSAAAEFFATQIEPNLFAEMQTLVRELQARGSEIWAVSSTCNWVVEEGMHRFEIPPGRILATRVAVVEGFVTPTLIDVPTDEAKVASLARVGIHGPTPSSATPSMTPPCWPSPAAPSPSTPAPPCSRAALRSAGPSTTPPPSRPHKSP